MFHRNDLIVAHAHMAMGIGVFFMVIAMFSKYIKDINKSIFYYTYLTGVLGIFIVLSISGFSQANIIDLDIFNLWVLRTIFGILTIFSLLTFITYTKKLSTLKIYNLIGVLNDGLGGVFLILLASYLYPLVGFEFSGKYEYIVFAFVSMTGIIHLMALKYNEHSIILTKLTVIIRIFISALFYAIYSANILGVEALIISSFDIIFASIYLIYIKKENLCKDYS